MDFYSLSRLVWPAVNPGNFIALALVALLVVTAISRRWTRRLALAGAAVLVILLIVPVGPWLQSPLEDRFSRPVLPQQITGVLILGGGESPDLHAARGMAAHIDDEGRYVAAAELMRRFPSARMLFSDAHSEIARAAFAQMGMDVHRITFEGRARNTWENLLYSKELAKPQSGETWLLVTKAYHMPRAMGVATKVGWRMLPWPVDYRTGNRRGIGLQFDDNLNYLERAVHEWSGLLAYWATGKSAALFPSAPT